jgi:hypothetical protein
MLYALIEIMPEHLRASHLAARNGGSYPDNGAERRILPMEEAEAMIAADPEWASIIREFTEDEAIERELKDHGYAMGDRVRGGRPGTEDEDTGRIVGVQWDDGRSMPVVAWDSEQTAAAPWSAIEAS